MVSELRTFMIMRGTTAEMLTLTKVLRVLETEQYQRYLLQHDCEYLRNVQMFGAAGKITLAEKTEDEVIGFLESAGPELSVGAAGPWGKFTHFDTPVIFEKVIDALPGTMFSGVAFGDMGGVEVRYHAANKNGILHMEDAVQVMLEDEEDDSVEFDVTKRYYDPQSKTYLAHAEMLAKTAAKSGAEKTCAGLTFAMAGNPLWFVDRAAFSAYVKSQGGKSARSVNAKTNYLVCNSDESHSAAYKKATALGIPVITELEFIDRFGW